MDGHFTSSQCAGLIEADGIDTSEGFDRVEILDEDFALTEANSGKSENGAGKENKTFGNHIDERGNSASDSVGGAGFGAKSSPEQERANGDEGVADIFNDVVHEFEELAVGGFDGGGLLLELGDKIVVADVLDFGLSGTRNHKATRGEVVAGMFFDIVLLAGDKGLVDLYDT